MKKFLFIWALLLFITACNKESATAETAVVNNIKESVAYKNYVAAYNDYLETVAARPKITSDFLQKKITDTEFADLIEKNAAICGLKRKIFLTQYEIVQTMYDTAADSLRLDVEQSGQE